MLYTDAAVAVVVKPRGVLSEDAGEGSLPALLKPSLGTLYPVHRLDRAVGGVMVYARDRSCAAALSRAVAAHQLKKEYIAVLEGAPEAPSGLLRDLLFKDSRQNKSFVVNTPRRGAREAVLTYQTVDAVSLEDKPLTLVSILLETGRSHQIRVQFSSRQTPLVGDGKYGARVKAGAPALFAKALTFPHPKTGKPMRLEAPTPTDFPWSLFEKENHEIEHKYLIAMPDHSLLLHGRKLSITQTYLLADCGETHRVRRIAEGDKITYTETRKRRINDLHAMENEREVSAEEYEKLLTLADPSRAPIEKVRYLLPHGARTLEIDVYPFWQDRAILEIEVASEGEVVTLPPFICVLFEVTGDKRYKNVNLAKAVPNDDISRCL